jgi:hypothetical protein
MSGFSLSDSHSFNRANHSHKQHWQHLAEKQCNVRKKASNTSLHLLRLQSGFIFVLCASAASEGNATVGHQSDNQIQTGRAGCALSLSRNPCDRSFVLIPGFICSASGAAIVGADYSVLPQTRRTCNSCVPATTPPLKGEVWNHATKENHFVCR